MPTANASCPLDLTPTTIAAWRDGALSADEAARIAAHVPGCPACQREIARWESLDDALRRQPVPASDGQLWRDVRAGITSNRDAHSRTNRQTARRLIGAGSALAAVLLLALGFAQLFRLHGATTSVRPGATGTISATATAQGTPAPLPTVVPASPAIRVTSPNWQQAMLPVQGITWGEQSSDILTFGVAATDGAIAYSCYSTSDRTGSQVTIYHTSDRALHWTRLVQFPLPGVQTSDCTVQVDTLDANRAFVNVLGQNTMTLQGVSLNELTEDGGATWTKLSYDDTDNPYLFYDSTSVSGRAYALRQQNGNGPVASYNRHLSVSTDHLRTWQAVDSHLIGANQVVSHFWVRADGGLLTEVSTMTKNSSGILMPVEQSLWTSDDGGAHWKRFAVPLPANEALLPGIGFLVQIPDGNAPWRVCAGYAPPDDLRFLDGIVCTFDSGQTWSVRPALCKQSPCSAEASRSAPGDIAASWMLAADDSILVIASDSTYHLGFYRLPAHSSQWQYLGPVTGANAFLYAPSSDGGVIWLYAGGTYLAHLSGIIGGHQSLPGTLSTATFP